MRPHRHNMILYLYPDNSSIIICDIQICVVIFRFWKIISARLPVEGFKLILRLLSTVSVLYCEYSTKSSNIFCKIKML